MKINGVLFLVAWILPICLCAQVPNGSISGHVFDPSGKTIANAEIEIRDALHGTRRTATSDSAGLYRVVELPPALYAISASAHGFDKTTRTDVSLLVGTPLRIDFHLPVAGIKQSVEVTAVVQQLPMDSSEQGTVLDQLRIQTLPLNRRDFLQLALLAAGVFPPVEDSELSTRGSFAMHVNGGREEHNNFLLDGVDNNDPYVSGFVLQPSVDAIQEFKIGTNAYSAEYGRGAAGQVNVVTRRGTNQFHGFLYEYFRNRVLEARNFFDGSDRPKYNRNQFGLGAGGPIARDKSYFFFNGDFLRERRGLSRLATVPTELMHDGNLSELGGTIVDPFTRQPFRDNIIPPERISPIARKILDLFPPANRPGLAGNFLPAAVMKYDQSQANVRLDHRLTAADEITARYSYGHVNLFEPYAEDTAAIPGFGDFLDETAQNAMIQYRRIFGPRTVNFAHFGFGRYARKLLPENRATDAGKLWGVTWLPTQPRDFGYPAMTIAGFSKIGDAGSLPLLRHTNSFQAADQLSLARGRHVFKLGGEVRRLQLDSVLRMLTRGSLSFSGALSGAGISDFLLGLPSFSLQSQADNPMTLRSTAYNAYFQDDWKVRPDLTLNLGMRYEYNTPAVDPTDRMSTYDWQTGAVVRVGTAGIPRSGIQPDRNNFAPRLGFAWSPAQNFVIRGGYGLHYDAGMFITSTTQYFNPPQFNMRIFFPSPAGLLTLTNPFPTDRGFTPPPSLTVLSPDTAGAYLQQWNLNVQRVLGPLGSLSLAYAGSKGTRLIHSRDWNQPLPAPGDIQARRPNPAFGTIMLVESSGNSNFHSLQMTFNRPLNHSLSLWSVYTWSKSIDDTSAFLETRTDRNFPQNSRNYRAERGLSSFDVAHRWALAYIYMLPLTNRWTRNVEIRGITVLQSGQPFTPELRFDNSNTGNNGGTTGTDRPNLLRDPKLSNPTADRWFNTNAFAVPAPYAFGDAGRNILHGPGYASFDISLARRFSSSDGREVTFEAQAFNLLNRTNLEMPEFYADETATFGRIFAAKTPRQIQFALRFSF